MYLFRNTATWSQGFGNVLSTIPLDLGCTCFPAARKSSTAVKLFLFQQNHRFPILGSPVTSAKARSETPILNPLISEYSPIKFMGNWNFIYS